MIKRMITEMSLGEQEKLRLLLITLFSYPSIIHSHEWKSLVEAADLHIDEYIRAITAGE